MNGFIVYPGPAAKEIDALDGILRDLKNEAEQLVEIQKTFLNKQNWQGTDADEFGQQFTAYVQMVSELLSCGQTYLVAAQGMYDEYLKNER